MAVATRPGPTTTPPPLRWRTPDPRPRREGVRSPFRGSDALLLPLLALVVWTAPASLQAAGWSSNLEPLVVLALGGLVVGYVLDRASLHELPAHLLALALGAEALIFAHASAVGGTGQASLLLARLGSWLQVVQSGGAGNDPLLFAMGVSALAWLLGYTSSWLLFRGESPWLAITACGSALLVNLSYARDGLVVYLGVFLFGAMALAAASSYARREEAWQLLRMRVERAVPARWIGGSLLLAGVLILGAWTLPSGGMDQRVATSWDRVSQPWQLLERDFDRIFAALQPAARGDRGLNFSRSLAPRGSFELADTPVLRITSPQPRYWRATTADRYTGAAMVSSDASVRLVTPDLDLLPSDQWFASRVEARATVEVLASRTGVAFVPDAPVRLSIPVALETRGTPQDVASVRLDQAVVRNGTYVVDSLVPAANVLQLRTAGEVYPAWVSSRYLQLPQNLPVRVAELSRDLTRNATNAYDKATAIEAFLRDNFTYSTRVATPPAGRDWVDFFVFDSKEGYCDYFAAAMVVMLRTQGVPARVASGFAPGEVDGQPGTWLIRENNAHSWVEAYFPAYGWITFEPSAILPVPERTDGPPPPPIPTPSAPQSGPSSPEPDLTADEQQELDRMNRPQPADNAALRRQLLVWVGIPLGLLALVAACAAVLGFAWRRGISRLAVYQRPYAQLVRLAIWLGVTRPHPSRTPYEVAETLAREVPAAEGPIRGLTRAYVEGTYGNRPPREDPWPSWVSRERQALARAFLTRRLRRFFRRD